MGKRIKWHPYTGDIDELATQCRPYAHKVGLDFGNVFCDDPLTSPEGITLVVYAPQTHPKPEIEKIIKKIRNQRDVVDVYVFRYPDSMKEQLT